jgi:hypothetical protein
MKRLALLLLLLTSCLKTEVLNAPIEQVDTVMYRKPYKPFPPKDTTDQDDRVPITFNPSVEDWEEQDINI